jgi:hypothetical protein
VNRQRVGFPCSVTSLITEPELAFVYGRARSRKLLYVHGDDAPQHEATIGAGSLPSDLNAAVKAIRACIALTVDCRLTEICGRAKCFYGFVQSNFKSMGNCL